MRAHFNTNYISLLCNLTLLSTSTALGHIKYLFISLPDREPQFSTIRFWSDMCCLHWKVSLSMSSIKHTVFYAAHGHWLLQEQPEHFLKQTKVKKQKNIWWHFPHWFHFSLIRWMEWQGVTWRQLWALCGLSCLALLLTVTAIWPAGPVGSEGCLEISLIEIIFLYSLFQCFHCTTQDNIICRGFISQYSENSQLLL